MRSHQRSPFLRFETMVIAAMDNADTPVWESTQFQNLIRYRPSGTYYARFKAGGRLVRQSLETTVFSVAKQRLPEKIREHQSRHESVRTFANGKMTAGDATQAYPRKIEASASVKPRSKAREGVQFVSEGANSAR